jgi:hypothetical protein
MPHNSVNKLLATFKHIDLFSVLHNVQQIKFRSYCCFSRWLIRRALETLSWIIMQNLSSAQHWAQFLNAVHMLKSRGIRLRQLNRHVVPVKYFYLSRRYRVSWAWHRYWAYATVAAYEQTEFVMCDPHCPRIISNITGHDDLDVVCWDQNTFTPRKDVSCQNNEKKNQYTQMTKTTW